MDNWAMIYKALIRQKLRGNGYVNVVDSSDACWEQADELVKGGWMLDTHSTFLSRSTNFHRRIGKLMFVKVKKENDYV